MPKYILAIVGLLYLGLSLWCATAQATTSQKVGLTRQPGQGESEYLTVYGGLQMALAIMFLIPLIWESTLSPMLLSCVIVHACLVFFRTVGFVQFSGFTKMTYQLAAGEWIIFVVSLGLLVRQSIK